MGIQPINLIFIIYRFSHVFQCRDLKSQYICKNDPKCDWDKQGDVCKRAAASGADAAASGADATAGDTLAKPVQTEICDGFKILILQNIERCFDVLLLVV